MSDVIRSFMAIELPEQIVFRIRSLQEDLKSRVSKVRWVRPENIHLTLKFLGNIRVTDIEKIKGAVTAAVIQALPISLTVKGVGVFPGMKRPRVIWVGMGGDLISLNSLQKLIEDSLASIGIAKEKRKFSAHLTIGRVKGGVDVLKMSEAAKAFGNVESEPFKIDRFFLFKSDLKPKGPEYSKLITFAMHAS